MTALRPIHLLGRAGRHRASWTGQGADTTGQRSQICLGRTEKRCAKHFAPCHRCRRDFDRRRAVILHAIMQGLDMASVEA
jgi:hypothetical protein